MSRELTWAENDTAKRLCGLRHGQHMALHDTACDICRADAARLVDAPPSERVPEVSPETLEYFRGGSGKYFGEAFAALEYCAALNRRGS